jgi:hypothetical protein
MHAREESLRWLAAGLIPKGEEWRAASLLTIIGTEWTAKQPVTLIGASVQKNKPLMVDVKPASFDLQKYKQFGATAFMFETKELFQTRPVSQTLPPGVPDSDCLTHMLRFPRGRFSHLYIEMRLNDLFGHLGKKSHKYLDYVVVSNQQGVIVLATRTLAICFLCFLAVEVSPHEQFRRDFYQAHLPRDVFPEAAASLLHPIKLEKDSYDLPASLILWIPALLPDGLDELALLALSRRRETHVFNLGNTSREHKWEISETDQQINTVTKSIVQTANGKKRKRVEDSEQAVREVYAKTE